jgi:hypothetical protein
MLKSIIVEAGRLMGLSIQDIANILKVAPRSSKRQELVYQAIIRSYR